MSKKIRLKLYETEINKLIGSELDMTLGDNANIIDIISEIDKMIVKRGTFPSKYYGSLLHWVYNPAEKRFYESMAINAFTESNEFMNIRNEPHTTIPNNSKIILIPGGPCTSSHDKLLSYEEFKRLMK